MPPPVEWCRGGESQSRVYLHQGTSCLATSFEFLGTLAAVEIEYMLCADKTIFLAVAQHFSSLRGMRRTPLCLSLWFYISCFACTWFISGVSFLSLCTPNFFPGLVCSVQSALPSLRLYGLHKHSTALYVLFCRIYSRWCSSVYLTMR